MNKKKNGTMIDDVAQQEHENIKGYSLTFRL